MQKKRDKEEREEIDHLKKYVLLLQSKLEEVTSPPYIAATVLDIGDKTVRVAVDNVGSFEVSSDKEVKEKIKKGSRVVLNEMTKAIVDFSEFSESGGATAIVEQVMESRLKVSAEGRTYLVLNGLEQVKAGDEVLLDPSANLAVERFAKNKTKYDLEEVPEAPWENIGGLEETIRQIKQEIEDPFTYKDVYARYGRKPARGILLYGPPGCGKTLVAKSIAYNLSKITNKNCGDKTKGRFINVKGPEILDKWVGNSEANIRRIYQTAREVAEETKNPVVIFIDEAESVLKTRGSGISTDIYDSIVPQFLSEMDGMSEQSNVITILATNREDILDPGVLRDGRVDKKIQVPRPGKRGCGEIFEIYLKSKPLQPKIFGKQTVPEVSERLSEFIYEDDNLVYKVVSAKDGNLVGKFTYKNLISGALIKGIVDRASTYAIEREIKSGDCDRGISQGDLEKAMHKEFKENTGFAQVLVKDDWEDVFGAQGKMYQDAQRNGYLILENVLQKR